MIIDVPQAEDFREAAIGYLNLAWSDSIALHIDGETCKDFAADAHDDYDLVNAYWKRCQRQLATCALLLHQGTEFLLKAAIAQVSPFLLLDSADGWAGRYAEVDTSFVEFRTVASHHLIRLHDTTCRQRLSPQFKTRFELIRRRRNSLIHGHSAKSIPTSMDIVRDILLVCDSMIGPGTWPQLRRDYHLGDPYAPLDDHGNLRCDLICEFDTVLRELSPAECVQFFTVQKKQRRYLCPTCALDEAFPDIKSAILLPNTPTSQHVFCLGCGKTVEV